MAGSTTATLGRGTITTGGLATEIAPPGVRPLVLCALGTVGRHIGTLAELALTP